MTVEFVNTFLSRCEYLGRLGVSPSWRIGSRVGRGFADVGAEVFSVLGPNRVLSLFTGAVTELSNEEEKKHFFPVPSVDELVSEIEKRGWTLAGITFEEGRYFKARFMPSSEREMAREVTAPSLTEVLLESLLLVCEQCADDQNCRNERERVSDSPREEAAPRLRVASS